MEGEESQQQTHTHTNQGWFAYLIPGGGPATSMATQAHTHNNKQSKNVEMIIPDKQLSPLESMESGGGGSRSRTTSREGRELEKER